MCVYIYIYIYTLVLGGGSIGAARNRTDGKQPSQANIPPRRLRSLDASPRRAKRLPKPMRLQACTHRRKPYIREMGAAPRNPAPGNHFLVWIVKPSGCHCADASGGKECRRVPTPLRSTPPFSDQPMRPQACTNRRKPSAGGGDPERRACDAESSPICPLLLGLSVCC